ncbi:MAG: helix-turn-helix transcriptional regulator, partial [Ignavibacteria bacterium]|nr:helix-turn-helix transcriptional regulator [Ignavibacteria bacterium]
KETKSFIEKITELEALYGQKETAKKLGVSPSTLRNYKTGKTAPKKDKAQKVNRVYGQNKKKITPEKVERYKKNTETKKENRRKQIRNNPRLQSVQSWVNKEFTEDYIKRNILAEAPPFIAPIDGRGQFTDGASPLGIPKGTKFVILYGLYTSDYNQGEGEGKQDYLSSRFPITLRKQMNVGEALDYLEGKFFQTSQQSGKRRLNPTRFIGYELA